MSLYDVAETENNRRAALPGYHSDSFEAGAEWGAGWAFALVGMAKAIAEREAFCKRCGIYFSDCSCPYWDRTSLPSSDSRKDGG